MFFRGRKEGRFLFGARSDDHQMENQQPFMATQQENEPEKIVSEPQQQPIQTQTTGQYQVPPAGQYTPQGQYLQAGYQPSASPQPTTPSPYQTSYPPAQELYAQQSQQYGQYPQQ